MSITTGRVGVDELVSPDPPEYTQRDPGTSTSLRIRASLTTRPLDPAFLTWASPTSSQSHPSEDPLEYTPTIPTTYTFFPVSSPPSTMLLLPPPGAPETRPRYHISVSLDPFMPAYATTCVRRGGSGEGEVVGEFRCIPLIAASVCPSTVLIRGQEHHLDKVMVMTKRTNKFNQRHWTWNAMDNEHSCTWDCSRWPFGPFVCHSRTHLALILAKFIPARPLHAPALSTLEVMPAGQRMFDDIVMSVLIVERRRLGGEV